MLFSSHFVVYYSVAFLPYTGVEEAHVLVLKYLFEQASTEKKERHRVPCLVTTYGIVQAVGTRKGFLCCLFSFCHSRDQDAQTVSVLIPQRDYRKDSGRKDVIFPK